MRQVGEGQERMAKGAVGTGVWRGAALSCAGKVGHRPVWGSEEIGSGVKRVLARGLWGPLGCRAGLDSCTQGSGTHSIATRGVPGVPWAEAAAALEP